MRLTALLLFVLSLPLVAQPVLTISKEQRVRTVAPFAYYLEDLSHKLSYEQVARYPLDSFKPVNRQGALQFGMRSGTMWLRFQVNNQTERELMLLSTQWRFTRLDVYVVDEKGQLTVQKLPSTTPLDERIAPMVQAFSTLGRHPRTVHLAAELSIADFYNDYLQLADMGYIIHYQKQTALWHGVLVGIYLLVFLFAIVFFVRLRDPLIGWYAFFLFTNTHWFLDRSGYLIEFFGQDSWYALFRPYYPIHFALMCVWAIFLMKFIRLKQFSKGLYNLIIGWIAIDFIGHTYFCITALLGHPYPLMRIWTHALRIEYVGYLASTLFFLLVGVIYVTLKDFQRVRWYSLAFGIGLISMIVAILALFDISWLPHYPFNNIYFYGSVIEIILLGFILADRTSRERKEQAKTQKQLIIQLQENLHHQHKLLQIRDEIARDLHDEVGATLTGIATSAKVVQKKMDNQQPELKAVLGQMKNDSEEAIHTIRDTIWALNPDNDAPEKLIEKMKAVGFKLLTPHDIIFVFENEVPVSQLPAFSMEQRRNLYLVYKEALHNIAKHSEATHTQVRIYQQNREFCIRISDDGKGFDPATITDGNGLKNFQKRAKEGGFEVNVNSAGNTGTELTIILLHLAPTHLPHDQSSHF